MILVIDIGNFNVMFGLYIDGYWVYFYCLFIKIDWQFVMFYQMGCIFWLMEQGIEVGVIEQVVVSMVVLALKCIFVQLSWYLFGREVFLVVLEIYEYLQLKIDWLEELGIDLFVNVVVVYYLYWWDCIIVDFGMVLIFMVVDREGQLLGVFIILGLKMVIGVLFQKIVQLLEVLL